MKKLFIITILFVLNSSGLYAQWQPDLKLTTIVNYTYSLQNNSKQVASYGNTVHAVWYDRPDGNYEIYYKRSTDAGASWGPDTRLTNAASNSEAPGIIAIGDLVHVAWHDLRDGDWGIYYKRSTDGGLNWGTDQRISNQPSNGFDVCLAGFGNVIHAVWQDSRNGVTQNGYEVYYKRSTDAGATWGPDVRMTNNMTNTLYPSISASGQYVHIVWYDTPESQQAAYYVRSTDEGVSWSSDIRLSSNAGASNWPCISSSGEFVHVVWTDTRDGNYEIYYKRSSDNGVSWSADTRLTNTSPNSYFPSIDASGGIVHVAWWDLLGIPIGNTEIYYKRSTNNGTSWETDIRLTNNDSYSRYPSVNASGASAHVVWSDWRDGIGIWYKRDPTGNLIAPVNSPVLVMPANYSINQSLTPLLNWDSVEYASAFRVQVSTDSMFGTSQFDTMAALSQIGVPAGKLSAGQKYFWRAKGSNVVGDGPWSEVWNFTTVPPPPSAPTLVSPANSLSGMPLTINLIWRVSQTALTYRVQAATDQSFTNLIINDSTLTDTSRVISGLNPLTYYWWRVCAKNAGGSGEYSEVWSFKTIGGPGQVDLFHPPDNSVNQPTSLTFLWSSAGEQTIAQKRSSLSKNNSRSGTRSITDYWFELTTDTLTFAGLLRDSTLSDTLKSVNGLMNSYAYYWRVKAKNETGWGVFSGWWKFTTAAPPPAVLNLKLIPGGFYNSVSNSLNLRDTFSIVLVDSATGAKVDSARAIIDSLTFSAVPSYSVAQTGKYFIYVYHKNHLTISSRYTQLISRGSSVNYDFTTDSSMTYDCNVIKVSNSPVKWGMIPADANQDGYVDALDQNVWIIENGQEGFFVSDFNGDKFVDALDQNTWISFNGRGTCLPFYFMMQKSMKIMNPALFRSNEQIPTEYALYQNYPNPFNPVTRIKFALPEKDMATIKIFDALGREVKMLINEQLNPGRYEVTFDGSQLASGFYICQLRTDKYTDSKKLILTK